MAGKRDGKPTVVEEDATAPPAEEIGESNHDPRLLFLVALIEKSLETGWLAENPETIEKGIKLFTPSTPKYCKQRPYAIKSLKEAAYEKSLRTGEPVEPYTEEQIAAEIERMEKDKQAKLSKKVEAKAA